MAAETPNVSSRRYSASVIDPQGEEIDRLQEQLETLRRTLQGIAHAPPPKKGTSADDLASELASVRLIARVVLDEWGDRPEDSLCTCGGYAAGRHNFDRSLCGVCDSMHYYCNDCGMQGDPCVSNPASEPHGKDCACYQRGFEDGYDDRVAAVG